MAFTLSGTAPNQIISNPTTDTGTFTWADIVTAGGATITLANGVYTCTAEINVGGGTLNIHSVNIVTTKPISCTNAGTGTINVGEKTALNGTTYTRKGSIIRFVSTAQKIGGYVTNDTGDGTIRAATTRQFNVYGSTIEVDATSSRKDLFLSNCLNAIFEKTNGANPFFVYTMNGASLEDSNLTAFNVMEMVRAPSKFSGMRMYDCGNSVMLYEGSITTRIVLDSAVFVNAANFGEIFFGNRIGYLNVQYDLTKVVLASATSSAYNMARFNVKLIGAAGNVSGANLTLTGSNAVNSANISFSGVTDASGVAPEYQVDVQSRVGTSGLVVSHGPFALKIRKFGFLEYTASLPLASNYGTAQVPTTLFINADSSATGSEATAQAQTGVAFSVASNLVTVTVTSNVTSQQIYNYWSWWVSQASQFSVPQNLIAISNGALTVTGSVTTSAVVSAGGNASSIVATGTISTTGSGAYSLPIEDSAGVRVRVSKSGGGAFNIVARRGSGTYTDLGFTQDATSVTYTTPKGQPVEVAMRAKGFVTYTRTIDTSAGSVNFVADMVPNPSINTSLDVSSYLAGITTSIDTSGASPVFVITFNQNMRVSGIELGKAVIHEIAGQELALRTMLPPGSTSTIAINADEITINLPAVRLALGASVTDVYMGFYVNVDAALAVNPNYVINPRRADNLRVERQEEKPALDLYKMLGVIEQSTVLAKRSHLVTVNDGVKRASAFQPHKQEIGS